MAISIEKKGSPLISKDVDRLQHMMGGPLPEDYLGFLRKYNGGIPETNEFPIPNAASGSGINQFLSAGEVINQKKKLVNRLPQIAWPIAFAEGGNYVCLVCREKPGIYFWDHELEQEEDEMPGWENMFLLASTFEEFWQALEPMRLEDIRLEPGQVKSVWIDPDFKPQF